MLDGGRRSPNGEAGPQLSAADELDFTTASEDDPSMHNHVTSLMPVARTTTRLRQTVRGSRLSSTHAHNGDSFIRPVQPLPRQPQPTVTSDDGHRTLRIRKHGNKKLPLPPLLDPVVISAKEKWTAMKPPPNEEELTDFHRELAANPYAQALATTIRQCHLTHATLPAHFLQPFSGSIVPHPTDTDHAPTISLVPSSRYQLPRASILTTGTYALLKRDVMEYLCKRRNWVRIVEQKMLGQWTKMSGRKGDVGKEWAWDQDVAGVLEGRLRGEVVQALKGALGDGGEGKQKVEPLEEEEKEERRKVAAVMIVKGEIAQGWLEREGLPAHTPVFKLQDLLDSQALDELGKKMDSERHGVWAIPTPIDDPPTTPAEDAPETPSQDARTTPAEDAPSRPAEDVPKMPSEDASTMPLLLALERLQVYLREMPGTRKVEKLDRRSGRREEATEEEVE